MTVAELLSQISSRELTEWMIFSQLEPFGSDADFLGHAITSSTVANVNRGKNRKAHKPDDFMPKFERQKQKDVSQAIGFAEMITYALGGKDKRE